MWGGSNFEVVERVINDGASQRASFSETSLFYFIGRVRPWKGTRAHLC